MIAVSITFLALILIVPVVSVLGYAFSRGVGVYFESLQTPDTLAARVLPVEHRLYPLVIGWYAAGRLALGGDTVQLDGLPLVAPVQFAATGGLDE